MAAKLKRKRKSSLSPDDIPRLLTEEENNKLFDSLFDGSTTPEPELERKPGKRSSNSRKRQSNNEPTKSSKIVANKKLNILTLKRVKRSKSVYISILAGFSCQG